LVAPLRSTVLIKRGAEADLVRTEFLCRPAVAKRRVPKGYRLKALDDELRRSRIRMEARLMSEARSALQRELGRTTTLATIAELPSALLTMPALIF